MRCPKFRTSSVVLVGHQRKSEIEIGLLVICRLRPPRAKQTLRGASRSVSWKHSALWVPEIGLIIPAYRQSVEDNRTSTTSWDHWLHLGYGVRSLYKRDDDESSRNCGNAMGFARHHSWEITSVGQGEPCHETSIRRNTFSRQR